eukprot:scaffold633_cov288-Ochromonas_danica.AAC.92
MASTAAMKKVLSPISVTRIMMVEWTVAVRKLADKSAKEFIRGTGTVDTIDEAMLISIVGKRNCLLGINKSGAEERKRRYYCDACCCYYAREDVGCDAVVAAGWLPRLW